MRGGHAEKEDTIGKGCTRKNNPRYQSAENTFCPQPHLPLGVHSCRDIEITPLPPVDWQQVVPGLDEGVSQLSIGERAKVRGLPTVDSVAKSNEMVLCVHC